MRCLLMLWHWLLSAISRNQPCTRIERKRCLLTGENPTATTGNKPRLQSLCRARSRAKRCPGSRADGGVAGTRETGCRVTERDVRRRRDTERSGVAAQVCESACALPAPPCQRARPPLGGPGPPRGGPPREPLSARRRRRSPFSIGWEGLWPRQPCGMAPGAAAPARRLPRTRGSVRPRRTCRPSPPAAGRPGRNGPGPGRPGVEAHWQPPESAMIRARRRCVRPVWPRQFISDHRAGRRAGGHVTSQSVLTSCHATLARGAGPGRHAGGPRPA